MGDNVRTDDNVKADDVCACCHHKNTPRDAKEQKQLQNRINRIIGQLNGIKSMIDDNRYCGDVLIQIGAVESALQSLGYIILQIICRRALWKKLRRATRRLWRKRWN